MSTDRPKIQGYVSREVWAAFRAFQSEREINQSQALEALLIKALEALKREKLEVSNGSGSSPQLKQLEAEVVEMRNAFSEQIEKLRFQLSWLEERFNNFYLANPPSELPVEEVETEVEAASNPPGNLPVEGVEAEVEAASNLPGNLPVEGVEAEVEAASNLPGNLPVEGVEAEVEAASNLPGNLPVEGVEAEVEAASNPPGNLPVEGVEAEIEAASNLPGNLPVEGVEAEIEAASNLPGNLPVEGVEAEVEAASNPPGNLPVEGVEAEIEAASNPPGNLPVEGVEAEIEAASNLPGNLPVEGVEAEVEAASNLPGNLPVEGVEAEVEAASNPPGNLPVEGVEAEIEAASNLPGNLPAEAIEIEIEPLGNPPSELPADMVETEVEPIGNPLSELPADMVETEVKPIGNPLSELPADMVETEVEPISNPPSEHPDTRLEQAISFLAGRCDGAITQDGAGFNGSDAGYGHWLADQIAASKPIIRRHAESALKMIRKYKGQLERGGLPELPTWEEIAHQYPEASAPLEQRAMNAGSRIELINNDIRLQSPYDPAVVARIKAIQPKGQFNKYKKEGDKGWYFPINAANALIENFSEEFEIDPKILHLIEEQKAEELRLATESAESTIELIAVADLDQPLPNGRTLFNHQKEGVQWLLAHRVGGVQRGGILADQMGLGKTATALVAAKAMRLVHGCHVFVVCPASLRDNWLREAEGVGVEIEVFSWAKLPKPLDTAKFVIVADEAHYSQNLSSQRTQELIALADSLNCLGTWLLTGTPIKNGRPINLFPLLVACNHPLALDRREYELHFCAARKKYFGDKEVWDNTGAAHLDELSKKTEDIILRRTKKECLDLPAKIRQMRPVELSASAQAKYEETFERLRKSYLERVALKQISNSADALVMLGQLRQAASSAKVEAAIDLAQEVLEQGDQVVVFTEFIETAAKLHEALGGEVLTGDTPTEERQALVDRFQAGESKVFIGTIKAGGVGLTLTAAQTIILVDRPWTPGEAEQAEDRCHRIGQSGTVTAIWLQADDTDKAIDALLEQKQQRIELVLKGKRKTLRGLSSPAELAKQLLAAMFGTGVESPADQETTSELPSNLSSELPDSVASNQETTSELPDNLPAIFFTRSQLTHRFGVALNTLKKYSLLPETEFSRWAISMDPDGLDWKVSPDLKSFRPVLPESPAPRATKALAKLEKLYAG